MEEIPTQFKPALISRTTYLWIETGVVLVACVLPLIVSSEADVNGFVNRSKPEDFAYYGVSNLVSCARQVTVVLFLIWRSNDLFGRFGLAPFKIVRDLAGGSLLFALLWGRRKLLWWGVRTGLSHSEYLTFFHKPTSPIYDSPQGIGEFSLLAIVCAASGFSQELLMRAYLIVRFEELFESTPVAVLLSTVLFAGYHGYQGIANVIGTALFGLILAIVFCRFRRLGPLWVAHAINNFIAKGGIP